MLYSLRIQNLNLDLGGNPILQKFTNLLLCILHWHGDHALEAHLNFLKQTHNYCYRSMSLNFQICQQFIQLKQTNTNKNRWVSYSSFQSELNAQASISCCWFFVLFFHFVHLCLFVCVCVCASTHMCMHVCMCVMKYTHLKAPMRWAP